MARAIVGYTIGDPPVRTGFICSGCEGPFEVEGPRPPSLCPYCGKALHQQERKGAGT